MGAAAATPPPAGAPPPPGPAPAAPPPPVAPPAGYPPAYPPPMYVMPPKVDFSTLLSGTFDVWVKNFGSFFLVYLILSLVTGALGLAGAYFILGVPFVAGATPIIATPTTTNLLAFIAYEIFVGVVGWVFASIVLGGVVDFSVRRYRGENVRIQDSLSKGLQRVLSILGANLLVTLITLGVIMLWVGLLIAGAIAIVATGGTAAGIAAVCGALIALPFIVVLVIYIDIALCLYAPAVMVEGAHAVDSLHRSWSLTRGHKWSIFGAGLILFILIAIIDVAISLGAGVTANPIVELVATALGAAITGAWIAILTSIAYDRIVRQPQPSVWPATTMPYAFPPR